MRRGKILIDENDIIGKRLGKLEVIRYYGNGYDITEGGFRMRHYYECKCDCGKMPIVQRGPLLNNLTRSCGCSREGRK